MLLLGLWFFSSCSKELDSECSNFATYTDTIDLVSLINTNYGDDFRFVDFKTDEVKFFNYDQSLNKSLPRVDTAFCTHVVYAEYTDLFFTDENGDYINFTINRSISSRSYSQNRTQLNSIKLNGKIYSKFIGLGRYFIPGHDVSLALSEDEDFILIYEHDHSEIVAIDDLRGNQWSLGIQQKDIFFCDFIFENQNSYKQNETFIKFNNLASKEFKYVNPTLDTNNYTIEDYQTWERHRIKTEQTCEEGLAVIHKTVATKISLNFSEEYFMTLRHSISNQSTDSEEPDMYFVISISDQNSNDTHHQYLVERNLKYGIEPSDYTFHDSYQLNDKTYLEVYEFGEKENKLLYNFEYGVIAFHDKDGHLNYLVP